jgi:hypothetical protein
VTLAGSKIDEVTARVKFTATAWAGEPESVTLKVTEAIVTAVGVPLISPVEAFSVSPIGNPPAVSCQL